MFRMRKPVVLLLLLMLISVFPETKAQEADSTNFSIYYSSPKRYIIADVQVSGIRYYDKTLLVQLSGIKSGRHS
jgi:outer membrane protein insertion porin family